ncbi:cytochrome c [Acidocella sp.]|uniref:c-type cytochrome n=1 Tax=Acidocella sp. TaxID=50710 RepID=UPI002603E91F|nr:cytochrome c [Acidocella sp.]
MIRGVIMGLILGASLSSAAMAKNIQHGKELFLAHCSACHLASGAGGVHFGSAVSADLRAPGLETTYHNNDKLLLRAILDARDETDEPLDAPMPAWRGKLTQSDAQDIIAYLKTLHS